MQTRFLHFADCHLGYRQYNQAERYNDFARSFLAAIDAAIAERVDFTILAGDLFHKRSIDALTLNQAMAGLEKLHNANIPCIAVEGNHEHAYYGDHIGWMKFLALRGLLILLDPAFVEGQPVLAPYQRRSGAYIEPVKGVRVYGLRYYGAGTPRALEAYAGALAELPTDGVEYTIFVTHAGLEGVLSDEAGGLSHRQLAPLRQHVDYLALGHIHKPFSADGWIYNPGSLETCSTAEAAWPERGYFLVNVDSDQRDSVDGLKHSAELHSVPRRPFHRINVRTDHYDSPSALMDHCREVLQRKARDTRRTSGAAGEKPVVELQLTGVLPFEHSALDISLLEEMVAEVFDPLHLIVRNLTRSADYAVELGESMSRSALERHVMADLFARDVRYREQSQKWAHVSLAVKQLVLDGANAESIVQELEEQVQQMRTAARPPTYDFAER